MEYAIGFIIAAFIALTGVGAGTITTPLLILFLGVPAPMAVATGLMFSAAVKLVLVPSQIARKQVSWRVLGFMLLGGLPGVLIGSLVLRHLDVHGPQLLLNGLLGGVLVLTALWQLFFSFRPTRTEALPKDRIRLAADSDVRCRDRSRVLLRGSRSVGHSGAAQSHLALSSASGRHRHRFWLSPFARGKWGAWLLSRNQLESPPAPDRRRACRCRSRHLCRRLDSQASSAIRPLDLALDYRFAIYLHECVCRVTPLAAALYETQRRYGRRFDIPLDESGYL